MKLVIALLCLSVFTVTKAADKLTAEESSSSFNLLVSMVGKEAIDHIKMMAEMKMKGTCLNLKTNQKHLKDLQTCGIETVTDVMAEIGQRSNKMFSSQDLIGAYKKMTQCKLSKIFGIDINNGIDQTILEEQSKKLITEAAKDDKTKNLMIDAMTKCSKEYLKGGKGDEALKELTKAKSCMLSSLLSSCKKMNKGPGIFMIIAKTFLTLVDEPKCQAAITPEKMLTPAIECINEANIDWITNGYPRIFRLKGTNSEENIKTTFNFVKNYVEKILMKSCMCIPTKLGFVIEDGNNLILSQTNTMEFILDLDWKNQTEKENFVALTTKCMVGEDDPMIAEINNLIETSKPGSDMQNKLVHKKLMVLRGKQNACMGQEFVEICGLNNDLTKLMVPIFNYELMGAIFNDFKGKGGVSVMMNMMKVLGGNMDISKILSRG